MSSIGTRIKMIVYLIYLDISLKPYFYRKLLNFNWYIWYKRCIIRIFCLLLNTENNVSSTEYIIQEPICTESIEFFSFLKKKVFLLKWAQNITNYKIRTAKHKNILGMPKIETH